MSIAVMSHVWKDSRHKGSDLLLLLAIADFASDDGVAYPSVKTLAAKTRLQVRNVQYRLRALQKSQELTIVLNAGPYGTHLYRVHIDGVQSLQGDETSKIKDYEDGGAIFAGEVQSLQTAKTGICPPAVECTQSVIRDPLKEKETKTPVANATSPEGEAPRRRKTYFPLDEDKQQTLKASIVDEAFAIWYAKTRLQDVLATPALDHQWEMFKAKALAKGYQYLSWRQAFQNWLTSDYQERLTTQGPFDRLSAKERQTAEATQRILQGDQGYATPGQASLLSSTQYHGRDVF